ncbi:MAG: DUF4871 domain-containing protein [Bacillota bacterium]
MKKNIVLNGLLLLVVLVFSPKIYTLFEEKSYYNIVGFDKAYEINNNKISEQEWETSPLFKVGEYTMIGQPSKLGIIDTTFISGKQRGIHWFLWGEQTELVKGTFKITATKQGKQPITLIENYAIAYGTKGSDAQVPTLITIPSSGLWKFDAYIDDGVYGSIVINVPY